MMRPPSTTNVKPPPSADERLEQLKRRLALLETVHADEKKQHQADVDRLKLDVSKAHKSISELDKVKKHNAALESRVQELKKASASEQTEIRDLRVKLRISENERSQLTSKQNEAGETKKTMVALESKRKDELRERDRKVAELEKALAAEKNKREGVEAKLAEMRGKVDGEVREAKEVAHEREIEIRLERAQAEQARESLKVLRREAANKEERLLERLDVVQTLLSHAAEEYGRLASSTVLKSSHRTLQLDFEAVQLCNVRLERKLASSEGQVLELASLIRQAKEQNNVLQAQLYDTNELVSFYRQSWKDTLSEHQTPEPSNDSVWEELFTLQKGDQDLADITEEVISATEECTIDAYRSSARAAFLSLTAAHHEVGMERLRTEQANTALETMKVSRDTAVSEGENLRSEYSASRKQLSELRESLDSLKGQGTSLSQQLQTTKSELRAKAVEHDQSLQKEQDINQRLTQTVRKHTAAEDALRTEIEQLTSELAEAERYQQAYHNLIGEVEGLAARNELAENEAERLSKFNAEILSNNNPAQRIMYLDRIRRELAETKHTLLTVTQERDNILAQSQNLRHELDMYTSVNVHPDLKPKTTITRVARIPLGQSTNTRPRSMNGSLAGSDGVAKSVARYPVVSESVEGEMTLDDLS